MNIRNRAEFDRVEGNDNISGKDILLICEHFYNYDIAIRDELIRLGAKSVYLHNIKRMPGSVRERISFKAFVQWTKNPFMRTAWTQQLKQDIGERTFDILLCLPLPTFKKSFLRWLKERNPNIKTILFLWDRQCELGVHFSDYFKLFDSVVSFDRDDARKFGIDYYPDFYLPTKPVEWESCRYDISFVGTCHYASTRYRAEIMQKIQTICDNMKLESFFYLKFPCPERPTSPSLFRRIKLFLAQYKSSARFRLKHKSKPFYHEDSLGLNTVNEIYRWSRVILDLNHRNRQGMTINAITALALGKKLITTNYRIKEEPFYNANDILVIDEEIPVINKDFFKTKPTKIDMSALRLDNWLKHIVNT